MIKKIKSFELEFKLKKFPLNFETLLEMAFHNINGNIEMLKIQRAKDVLIEMIFKDQQIPEIEKSLPKKFDLVQITEIWEKLFNYCFK